MRRREDLPVGVEGEVPYDQTGFMGGDTPPDAGPGVAGANDPSMQGPGVDQLGGDVAPAQGMQDQTMPPDFNTQPDVPATPEDIQVEQMTQALDDPNTPPQVAQQIQAALADAARRKLAGLGTDQYGA